MTEKVNTCLFESVYKQIDQWYLRDSKWQQVITGGTTTSNKGQQVTINDNQSSCIKVFLSYFPAQAQKSIKNPAQKIFLIFRERKVSCSNIKKILIFSQRKAFLISLKTEPALPSLSPKNKRKPTPKNIPYLFSNGTF